MRTRHILLAVLTTFGTTLPGRPQQALAATYVSPAGNDANDGSSWATAKATIQAGVDAVASNGTVLVASGQYDLTSSILITNPITVQSVSGANTTFIDGGFPATSISSVKVLNDGAVFDGFTVRNSYEGISIGSYNGIVLGGFNGIVRNCVATGCNNVGIRLYHGGIYQSCTVAYNPGIGLTSYQEGDAGDADHTVNLIIYGNGSNIDNYSSSQLDHCFTNDPHFYSTNDFHLLPDSPCINAGTNLPWMATDIAADGNARIQNGIVDIGAYESGCSASNLGAAWTQATPNAPWSARFGHTSVALNGRMWVMGGQNGSNSFNDVWSSPDGVNWTQATASAPWSARYWHTSVVLNGRMWVMGGQNGSNRFNDVWSSADGTTWTQATNTAPWGARYGHTAVALNGRMWVLGGSTILSDTNDVWSSTDGINWTQSTSAAPWPARRQFASVVLNGKMWVLGGGYGFYNDVWSSADGTNWTQVTPAAPWAGRHDQAALVVNGQMWVLSGYIEGDGDAWSSADGANWTEVAPDVPWGARVSHAAVAFIGQMWVLGGTQFGLNGGVRNDVWHSPCGNPVASSFQITAIARQGNDIRVTWNCLGGQTNVLQSTRAAAIAGYTTNFADVSPVIVASGDGPTSTNYLDAGAAYAPALTAPSGQNATTSGVPSMVSISAADTRGMTDSLGQALPIGSLLMLGTFSVGEPIIQSNFFAGNVSAIMSNFTPYGTSFAVGDGTGLPASWSVTRSAAGFGGQQIYLLAIDKPAFAAATHLGIYSAQSWIFPAGGGTNTIALEDVTDFVIGAQSGSLTINLPLGGTTYTFDDTARLDVLPGRVLFYRVRLAQ